MTWAAGMVGDILGTNINEDEIDTSSLAGIGRAAQGKMLNVLECPASEILGTGISVNLFN